MKHVLVGVMLSVLVVASGCKGMRCGNGHVNPEEDEDCDDGNHRNGDGCSASCHFEGCGNFFEEPGEACDDGEETAACDGDCTLVVCGDGYENLVAEECDDGNTVDHDGCSSTCRIENASCGDGVTEPGEDCDDGGESESCDADCTAAECGDSVVNPTAGEQCDDGGTTEPGDPCTDDCQLTGDTACGVSALVCDGGFAFGSTADPVATDVIDSYPCLVDADKSGPEVVYDWFPTVDGIYSVALEGSAPLDVIVVEAAPACGIGVCVASGHAGMSVPAVAGTHYLIVVDTNPGATAEYGVGVFCP